MTRWSPYRLVARAMIDPAAGHESFVARSRTTGTRRDARRQRAHEGRTLAALMGLVAATLVCGCQRDHAVAPQARAEPRKAALEVPSDPTPVEPAEAQPTARDWCGGHGLPESKCTKCNPELIERFEDAGDWCEAHGFPESACPECNPVSPPGPPASASPASTSDWCIEHGLPESKCPKCNPSLLPELRSSGDWCEEHGYPESVCPTCNPQVPPAGAEQAAIESRVILLDPPSMEEAAGIRGVRARSAAALNAVSCTARIAFNSDRSADVRAIVAGIVREVSIKHGDRVEAGAPLFTLESTRVSELQVTLQTARQKIRTARANLGRQRELRAARVASARQVEVARQELATARGEAASAEAALEMAGASADGPLGRYVLSAPVAGVVVRRPAVIGLFASEETSLATIVDTSTMWALCDVPEADASRVALGQRMTVRVDGGEGRFAGTLTWIASEVDPRTRTVSARAELANPDGALRAHQFARARIQAGEGRTAVAVPPAAVQRVSGLEVVFVRTRKGAYQPRVVRRGDDSGGEWVQVEGAVREGDVVVVEGAVLLRTEVMPGSIGAGCCETTPPGD